MNHPDFPPGTRVKATSRYKRELCKSNVHGYLKSIMDQLGTVVRDECARNYPNQIVVAWDIHYAPWSKRQYHHPTELEIVKE